MYVFDENANNNIYKLETMESPDYPLETKYSQIDYWKCSDCNSTYTYSGKEKYHISTDFNSFEEDISWYQCKTNCEDMWDMG
tara:strand:- start:311 stop:556 length:246 start_codon:yes stop_codon:yes gene_type:complete